MARILMVDDDPVARQVVGDALAEAGHTVRVVAEGTGMMQQLLREPAEVVLLDVQIPSVSGDRLADILRKGMDPPYPRIILFSSLPKEELSRMARRLQVQGFLRKGCSKTVLVKAVEAAAGAYGNETLT